MVSMCACTVESSISRKLIFLAESTILLLHCWQMFEFIQHDLYLAPIVSSSHTFQRPSSSSYDPEQYICWTRMKTPYDNRYILIIYYIYIYRYTNITYANMYITPSSVFRWGYPPTNSPPLRFLIKLDGFSEAPKPNAGPHKLRECLPLIVPGTAEMELLRRKFSHIKITSLKAPWKWHDISQNSLGWIFCWRFPSHFFEVESD